MRILKKQMSEVGRLHGETFVDRVTAFLQKELPGEPVGPARGDIAALIERARGYDLTLERTIVTYVITARLLGHDFDERLPDARASLKDDKPVDLRAMDLEELALAALHSSPAEGS